MWSLDGKYILVTGATDGIGKQTALELAEMGATVLVHGRNENRVKVTIEEIRRSVRGAKLEAIIADFSSLHQVRQLTDRIQSQFPSLDVLINNAGVYMKTRVLSQDGYEMTFAVNHLAHFLLTNLLLHQLTQCPSARVITVSSMVHSGAPLDFQNLNAENYFDAYSTYAFSKLANILFSKELAVRLQGSHITSNSLHPGTIGTKMLRTAFNMSGASVKEGAATPVYLAASSDVENITGKYFVNKRETSAASITDDVEVRKRFWETSKALVRL